MTTASTPNYLYKVGDFCYFEVSSSGPYQIRRIDELLKTSAGQVEVRTTAYCRKRDLPARLQEKVASFEKDHKDVPDLTMEVEEEDTESGDKHVDSHVESSVSDEEMREHLLSHREVYLTRMVENLPASLIRGKCTVFLLAEFEDKDIYLRDEDVYFYTHTWDPNTKTLSREKGGDIRVGSAYQAEVPTAPSPPAEDGKKKQEMEEDGPELGNGDTENHAKELLMWEPGLMSDVDIDNFLLIMRSVGTFGRALDWNAAVKQPSLHLTAASASRDVTLANAMDILHRSLYDLTKCLKEIVGDGPMLCRDQMELWTATEAGLFEEALEKYGKDFEDIRVDLLPWKTMQQIIEYYYMWKTSDRFVQNKRVKAAEAEGRLKQIIIQPYTHEDRVPTNEVDGPGPGKCCEGCFAKESSKWYAWGGVRGDGFRLCKKCWDYWKKYGDSKRPLKGEKKAMLRQGPGIASAAQTKINHNNHNINSNNNNNMGSDSMQQLGRTGGYLLPPSQRATQMKNMMGLISGGLNPMSTSRTYFRTRPAIYFIATQLMKQVRRVGEHIFKPKRAARQPFQWINSAPIKEHYQHADPQTLARSKRPKTRKHVAMAQTSLKLLAAINPGFSGSYPTPSYLRSSQLNSSNATSSTNDARHVPETSSASPPFKRLKDEYGNSVPVKNRPRNVNGKLIFPDAPEDFYYHPAPDIKKERKGCITTQQMKKIGRRQADVFAVVYNPTRLTRFIGSLPTAASSAPEPPATSLMNNQSLV